MHLSRYQISDNRFLGQFRWGTSPVHIRKRQQQSGVPIGRHGELAI